ncbi:MAG: glycosyltransferase [Acidimicrobiia bacterium]|nr:glycosyltransferase [Acidimicrobiia bacterium]
MTAFDVASGLALAAWACLLVARGGFWRADQRLFDVGPGPAAWPEVVAVIPARDEAAFVGRAVESLLRQDYPGRFTVELVDDNSRDGTADVARKAAAGVGAPERLRVVTGAPLAPGWTGKLWAVHQGLAEAACFAPPSAYVLLTDADIVHESATLRRLVAKAETEQLYLVSLMVKLRCEAGWEKLLIPAFIFFFQKLYPFPWVNDPNRPTAAAAGGCMLVRRDTLADIGGVEHIRDRLIDDCALAREVKARGPIWLGLAEHAFSLRPYDRLGEVWRMVARSAFEQLNRSLSALLGTLAGMVVLYVVPPVAAVYGVAAGEGFAAFAGVGAWGLMAAAYAPTVRLYGIAPPYMLTLPLAGVLYALMTLDSARRHWAGKGGGWKGRSYS